MRASATVARPGTSRRKSVPRTRDVSVTPRAGGRAAQRPVWCIRPISREDLPAVRAGLPAAPYRTHLDDLDWQHTGAVTELVAWQASTPVGSGFIHWPGPRDASIARRMPTCPEIFRLEVVETHRSKGVGTALIRALEALARARGFVRVGLGVGTGNRRARLLYERLGYRAVKAAAYVDRCEYPDADGRRRVSEEPCIFMTKHLGCAARGRTTPRRSAA